ncbi:putative nuclease HARBI1 [Lineus longissimus]|uniref:putative nuclease HARBI1 n=1 Tax=Lineus longissimus TaxID=88925 RepID=UPI00315CDFB7
MPRPVLLEVINLLEDDVSHPTRRNHAVPADLQILSTIRFYATGTFQLLNGDTVGLSQPTISRTVARVSEAIGRRARHFISFPEDPATQQDIMEGFFDDRRRIPNVLGCVDGSFVQIKCPSMNEEAYVFRMMQNEDLTSIIGEYDKKLNVHSAAGKLDGDV